MRGPVRFWVVLGMASRVSCEKNFLFFLLDLRWLRGCYGV